MYNWYININEYNYNLLQSAVIHRLLHQTTAKVNVVTSHDIFMENVNTQLLYYLALITILMTCFFWMLYLYYNIILYCWQWVIIFRIQFRVYFSDHDNMCVSQMWFIMVSEISWKRFQTKLLRKQLHGVLSHSWPVLSHMPGPYIVNPFGIV